MSKLADKQKVARRRATEASVARKLARVAHVIIPDDVHLWAIDRLRNPDPPFSHRSNFHVNHISEAVDVVEGSAGTALFKKCCLFDYQIEEYCSAVVDTSELIASLRNDPFFFSSNGIVVSNSNFTTFLVLDYDGLTVNDGADVSVIGNAGLEAYRS